MLTINIYKHADKPYEEQVGAFRDDAISEARARFQNGDFSNPYSLQLKFERDLLIRGMAKFYDEEIKVLLTERICPCCGQPTRGDLDY